MAAPRLTDSQKSELVARYRDGAASQELADAYGCSINTVTRVVKATLTASDYEQLKQQRAKGGSKSPQAKEPAPDAAEPEVPEVPEAPALVPVVAEVEIQRELASEPDLALEAPVVLAIADADDFADDGDGDDLEGVDAEIDDADDDSDDFVEQFVAVPIALMGTASSRSCANPWVMRRCRPAFTCWWTRRLSSRPSPCLIFLSSASSPPRKRDARP